MLSIVVPDAIVNVPAVVPNAAAALILIVPALCATPPVKVLVPESVNAPDPAFVSLKPPLTTPPSVNVLAEVVMVVAAANAVAPVPKFKLFVPVNVKLRKFKG